MRVLARLFKAYMKYQWRFYVTTLLLTVGEVVLNVYLPQLSRAIVDAVVESSSDLSYIRSYLFSQSLLYLVWGLIRSVVVFVEIYLFEKTAETVSLKIRRDLYDHVQRLDFSFHNKARTGDLMSRVTSDVQAMRELVGFGIVHLIYCLLMILLVVGWMAYTTRHMPWRASCQCHCCWWLQLDILRVRDLFSGPFRTRSQA